MACHGEFLLVNVITVGVVIASFWRDQLSQEAS
jgi:hypothetical protein